MIIRLPFPNQASPSSSGRVIPALYRKFAESAKEVVSFISFGELNGQGDTRMTIKVPNGDVSKAITAFNSEVKSINAACGGGGGEFAEPDTHMKARFLASWKILCEKVEYYTNDWEKQLKEIPGFKEDFVDLDRSVYLQEGARMTEIAPDVFSELTIPEIKIAAKVTEKGLKDANRADLISKYKIETGRKAPSLKITVLKS
jgi:hypothetical protein